MRFDCVYGFCALRLRTHERTSLRAGEDSLRPRTQRTSKYHANVPPLQGVSLRGRPQAVMIHNLLVGCWNLRSSLEEAHSSVTPGKDAQRTQPGDSRKQRNSASKRLTSRMRKIITIYELYKSFIISISVLMTNLSKYVRSLECLMMRDIYNDSISG